MSRFKLYLCIILLGAKCFSYSQQILDYGHIRVWYSLSYITDTNTNKIKKDLQVLEIGKISKYYSYSAFHSDSLIKEYVRQHPASSRIPNEMGLASNEKPVQVDIFKNEQSHELQVFVNGMILSKLKYCYSETTPQMEWHISEDTLTVAGYLCQKVETKFRGRNYIAWFAPEIPISNGPWKFGGLPGLILKIYDKSKHYEFECFRLEQDNDGFPIYGNNKKDYKQTDRENFLKLEKNAHRKPVFFLSAENNMDPSQITGRTNMTFSYNPLELE